MQIQTDRNRKEIKSHGTYDFPVLVSHERLSYFERRTFLWHWHTELEWTYVVEGEIHYQINEKTYYLKPGQGVLCNSNMLHTGRPGNTEDCHYMSITLHPRLLGGYEDSFLQKNYVNWIVENPSISSIFLDPQVEWNREILEGLKEIVRLYEERDGEYDFRIYLLLMEGWLQVCRHLQGTPQVMNASRNTARLKKILTYIHGHYQEKITLENIAEEINICSSECCRFFKKYMKESLFDYLLDYRVDQSLPLLAKGEYSITEVAAMCGFSNSAYFSKVFRERMGYTPSDYQKMVQSRERKLKEEPVPLTNFYGKL